MGGVKIMKYYKQNNEIYAYESDGSQDYLIGDKVAMTAEELELHLNPAETPEQAIAKYESKIEEYVVQVCKDKGYRNDDSIAKYLVEGSPFKIECEALSLWIGAVWVYSYQVLQDVEDGIRPIIPTIEELIAELPKAP